MWLPKINYHRSDFFGFIRVRNKEEEKKKKEAEKKES
jgi:hypothetical protein